ncbi:MAG: hypothetical protein IJ188_04485 [Clostridia bacterium]|nr:hypothetical protein [Clostridia bacterium]
MTENYVYTEEMNRMDPRLIHEMNARVFFQSGLKKPQSEVRPWQYVEMKYRDMGLVPPSYIPPLETMEDAEIWMCLDDRVNRRMRMRESGIAV